MHTRNSILITSSIFIPSLAFCASWSNPSDVNGLLSSTRCTCIRADGLSREGVAKRSTLAAVDRNAMKIGSCDRTRSARRSSPKGGQAELASSHKMCASSKARRRRTELDDLTAAVDWWDFMKATSEFILTSNSSDSLLLSVDKSQPVRS